MSETSIETLYAQILTYEIKPGFNIQLHWRVGQSEKPIIGRDLYNDILTKMDQELVSKKDVQDLLDQGKFSPPIDWQELKLVLFGKLGPLLSLVREAPLLVYKNGSWELESISLRDHFGPLHPILIRPKTNYRHYIAS